MRVVNRGDWLEARKALLAEEKAHTRASDELAERRRALPWVRLTEEYVFEGPDGPASLLDLFEEKQQLMVYHFMFAPDWERPCKSCTYVADHMERAAVHFGQRDARVVLVSRAPVDKLMAFRSRMGWTLPWYSSGGSSFNYDFGVSFTDAQADGGEVEYNYRTTEGFLTDLPGASTFIRGDDGEVYHTYSCYGRGVEGFMTTYAMLDLMPCGRDEAETGGMGWVKFRDEYPEVGP